MINEMEVGDTVLTTSGFYGVLIDISDEDVIVEFGSNKNCRIPMQKAAIAQVEKLLQNNKEQKSGESVEYTGSSFIAMCSEEAAGGRFCKLCWEKYKILRHCSYKYTHIAQNCIQGRY